jgi:hypothetical protein
MSHKELPFGIWVFLPSLPPNTTEESLSQFFWKSGIAVTHNRIVIKEREELDPFPQTRQFALISFPEDAFTSLLTKAIGGELFDGVEIKPKPNRTKTASRLKRDTGSQVNGLRSGLKLGNTKSLVAIGVR